MLFRPSVQPYLISWFKYDPAREIARIGMPSLIIQGECDMQIGIDNAHFLAKADPAAQLLLIPNMNHILKDVSPSLADNAASYRDPKLPLDQTLISSISDFILRLKSANGEHHVQ